MQEQKQRQNHSWYIGGIGQRHCVQIREEDRITGIKKGGSLGKIIWASVATLAFTPSNKGNH